jgi:membrane-bound metal-dependent hydrolase YbcI (DUF457 family)
LLIHTHSVFGVFLTLIVLALFGIKLSLHYSIILFAILGSIIPDLDLEASKFGTMFNFIARPLERRFGHRTITHSLLGLLLASLGFFFILVAILLVYHLVFGLETSLFTLAKRWQAAFMIGYFSHLLLDMLTPRGVPLFWPDPTRDVFFKDFPHRPQSGSKAEKIIFFSLLLLLIISFPIFKYGVKSSLRWLIGSTQSLISEFEVSDKYLLVNFQGIFRHNRHKVQGLAEVLDVRDNLLVVRLLDHQPPSTNTSLSISKRTANASVCPAKIYTLADHYPADILTSKIKIIKTPHPIQIQELNLEHVPLQHLLKQIPAQHLVSGYLKLPKGMTIDIKRTLSFCKFRQENRYLYFEYINAADLDYLNIRRSYYLQKKQLRHQKEILTQELAHCTQRLATLSNTPTSNLTSLGRRIFNQNFSLNGHDSYQKLCQKQKHLQIKLQQLELNLQEHYAYYSGQLILRKNVLDVPYHIKKQELN